MTRPIQPDSSVPISDDVRRQISALTRSLRQAGSNSGATGDRPDAAQVGAGVSFYDATLSKPIWSDGTAWRDAAGTIV